MRTCATIGCDTQATKRGRQLCARCEVRIRTRARKHCAEDVGNPGGRGSRGGAKCGTPSGYTKRQCRCSGCTEAHTRAEATRRARMRAQRPTRYVDPHTTRALVMLLFDRGWTVTSLAERSGVDRSTIRRVLRADKRVEKRTYQQIRRVAESGVKHRVG